MSVDKIRDKTKKTWFCPSQKLGTKPKKIMSLKMSEGHRDKTKNVSKKSLNHAGLSGLGTKPKMSEKTGTKLGTEFLSYQRRNLGKCPYWSMGT